MTRIRPAIDSTETVAGLMPDRVLMIAVECAQSPLMELGALAKSVHLVFPPHLFYFYVRKPPAARE
jgi:hypothetical protein